MDNPHNPYEHRPRLTGRINNDASIFTAETLAIRKSLEYIKRSLYSNRKFVIFCDSKSVLESISGQESKNPQILKLLDTLEQLKKTNLIEFCWIPSHVGIYGNNVADYCAKVACNDIHASDIKIPYTDFIPKVKTYIKHLWKDRYRSSHNSRRIKLFEINPEIKPFYTFGLSRKDEVVLHRVRIGHTRFTHSYVMEGGDINHPPLCYYCHNYNLTVKHLLIQCTHFNTLRSRYLRGTRDMKDLFERFPHKQIIKFLKESHLYEQF